MSNEVVTNNKKIDSDDNEIKNIYNMPNDIKLLEFNELPDVYKSFGSFINEKEGWKINSIGVGMFGFESILYKTDDGGKNWIEIENNSKDNQDSMIPIRGVPSITFKDSNNGWLTANGYPNEGWIGLYKTTDGGYTWLFQGIDVPSKYKRYLIDTSVPIFFSNNVGLLFLRANKYDGKGYKYFTYLTVDGGSTWNSFKKNIVVDNIKWRILEQIDREHENLVKYEVIYKGDKWEASWLKDNYFTESWELIK